VPEDPLVSVLLPVWNGERFLAAAIASITAQTLTAFELIVVDDGSTDASAAIAQAAAARDPRIAVLTRPHGGITEALNAGIAVARGVYLARMDADDWADPSRLARQVTYLDAHPGCVAVGSAIEVIDGDEASLGVMRFPLEHEAILETLLGGCNALAHPSVLMRRASVLAAGGYRAGYAPAEDLDLWLRLQERGELANLAEPLLRYRRHPAAVSIRGRTDQIRIAGTLAAAARARRGLRRATRWPLPVARNPAAAYHFECARIALRGGERRMAIRHARAAIASAPRWPLSYAVLAACALPLRALPLLARVYTRLATA
jgi:glycosyltransferase involved in cell wall biosynthesis